MVTFVKNTLDHPILVQCYFRPFNDNPFWCENELIEYSAPVEIQPNEYKIVMDYVKPLGIKIFKGSDSTVIFESFANSAYASDLVYLSKGALSYFSEDEKKLGHFMAKQVVPKAWSSVFGSTYYYIQHERYLAQNIPWSLYPIHFDFGGCDEELLRGDEELRV